MIVLFAHVYPIQLEIHKLVVMLNVSSTPIVPPKRRVSTDAARIHVNQPHAVSTPIVVSTITPPTVIVEMDLWVMLSSIVCQIYQLRISQPIHAFHHHVQSEVFVMSTVMVWLFATVALTNSVTIIHHVVRNV